MAQYDDVDMDAGKRATYADLDATPEGDGKVYELLDGALRVSPRPKGAHSVAQGVLAELLHDALERAGNGQRPRWRFVPEPELRLGGDALVPDLAAWRLPLPSTGADGYFTSAPPWVCEVLSSSTAALDWRVKLPAYFRHGVGHVWLLDIRNTALHVLGPGVSDTHEGTVTVHPPPFDVPFELGALWRGLP